MSAPRPWKTTAFPFETKMKELSATLFQQMAEGAELDAAIRQNLKSLGYEE
jgi:type I restriction enzyme M protein